MSIQTSEIEKAELPRTLFVGRGKGAVCWYRCALPAMALGCDWIGALGSPPNLLVQTGLIADSITFEDFFNYEVVVLQQPHDTTWLGAIRDLQRAGVTVLYEIDDYVSAIRKVKGHDFGEYFDRKKIAAYELCMGAADGVICSTSWLAQRYRSVNPVTWACQNGIDHKRYALTRPERPDVGIGWAGATGHRTTVQPWLDAVARAMRERPNTRFVSVGQAFADLLMPEFSDKRCLSIPFSVLDTYPAAMTLFDIAIAPAGRGNFFRGKSDLRWLESSVLGITSIADPDVYPDIEHGVTGFHAATPDEAYECLLELLDDDELRRSVGDAARAYVLANRTVEAVCGQWARVLQEVGSGAQRTRAANREDEPIGGRTEGQALPESVVGTP